jgi:hypothetical protein
METFKSILWIVTGIITGIFYMKGFSYMFRKLPLKYYIPLMVVFIVIFMLFITIK